MFERPSPPRFAVPPGSCDCHVHLFGPFAGYPLDRGRLYTPDAALASDLFAMLDAMAEHPQRLRGVVVIDADAAEADLARMHVLGARGARLNLASAGGKSAAETARLVERLADRIAPLGWHLQMFVSLDIIAEIAPLVRRLAVDVVFDHMGLAPAARGTAQPGLAALVELMQGGRVWVKLSGTYRVSDDLYGNAEVTALARALIAANRDRVVWASDWPHLGPHAHRVDGEPPLAEYRRIDYGRLLSALADWAERDDIERILVRNPAQLYDFA